MLNNSLVGYKVAARSIFVRKRKHTTCMPYQVLRINPTRSGIMFIFITCKGES